MIHNLRSSRILARFFASFLTIGLAVLFSASFLPCNALAAQSPQPRPPAATQGNPAADTATATQLATKAAIKADATPIAVVHEGTDTLGSKLAYQTKEIFNSGTLFDLNDKDVPKLQMIITTASEFPSRPGVGSVYSVVWVYSERASVLSNYLAHESGIVSSDNLSDLADKLAARTSGLAAKHSYIFNR